MHQVFANLELSQFFFNLLNLEILRAMIYYLKKDNNSCLLRVIPPYFNPKYIEHNLLILLNVIESIKNGPCLFENNLTNPSTLK